MGILKRGRDDALFIGMRPDGRSRPIQLCVRRHKIKDGLLIFVSSALRKNSIFSLARYRIPPSGTTIDIGIRNSTSTAA